MYFIHHVIQAVNCTTICNKRIIKHVNIWKVQIDIDFHDDKVNLSYI